jgi:hypothetical protein
MESFDMDVLLIIPLNSLLLLFLWLASRELRKALTEIRTITRLKQSGTLQQGTITNIDLKRYPPTVYGKVVFKYRENKTTYRGKHIMSAASAKTLMKGDREAVIRYLPGQPRSARIESAFADSFERKRALIMGCALFACFLLAIGAEATGFVLGWRVMEVQVFTVCVFVPGGLIIMLVAYVALRFFFH